MVGVGVRNDSISGTVSGYCQFTIMKSMVQHDARSTSATITNR